MAFGPYVFTLTADEFAAYARRVGTRQAARLQIRYGFIAPLAGLALIGLVVGSFWLAGLLPGRAAATTLPVAALAFLCGKFLNHWQIGRAQAVMAQRLRADASIFGGQRTITLGADGVRVEAPDADASHRWRAYDEAERRDGLVLVWMGLAYALAIPERALAGADEAARLLDFARERIASARLEPAAGVGGK